MKKNTLLVTLFTASLFANGQSAEIEEVSITASKEENTAVYHASAPRTTDVVHMDLKVSFDWEHQYLNGEAVLTLKPYFYELDTFVLDAQGMEIKSIAESGGGRNKTLGYEYDGRTLKIAAGKTLNRSESMKVKIVYVSKPNELEVEGGAAITEAKGLYFINPTHDENGWMPQVWTQGEPASNSVWFPTVDQPNERMTHEIAITVPKSYTTVSNGRLDFTTNNSNGTRTDFWLMDQPHAPYLVMMAVGEFASQSDEWNGIPVNYYVEPEYANVARKVYPHTTEMLTFFSEILGTPYPWQKYDQITVREYVSGAMENTTGVIFGDFMYGDSLSWADGTGEDVVSHEMFHHWFGDLVTCESWANLPLNESFATYGEVLWKEHMYGEDEGAWHSYNDLRGYFREYNRGKSVDLIRYDYESVLGMFDGHSYAKGGRVLLMLRTILGDEAFFEGLRVYLEDNRYQSVEIHNLRLAFEKVSGLDLNWFFNQWFLAKGHPILQIEHKYDRESGQQIMTVTQTQDLSEVPLYRLPVQVDVHTSLGVKTYDIIVDREVQEFRFDVMSKPFLVHFDAQQYLLADIQDNKPADFLLHQLANGPRMLDRYEAVEALFSTNVVRMGTIVRICLKDDFHAIRMMSLRKVPELDSVEANKVKSEVRALLTDENTAIRSKAYEIWHEVYGEGDAAFYANATETETSYEAKSGAFDVWIQLDEAAALTYARAHVGKVRGGLETSINIALLQDPSRSTPDQVIGYLNTAGVERQPSIHLWLPKYMIQLNESDFQRVYSVTREIQSGNSNAEGYFNYGIRIARAGVQRELQNPDLSEEELNERKRWESQLKVLLDSE
ncbi:M1 family metallopeptidase [Phaeocystidibacter marisrubri]|uniref:Aminopeptidase N n=1 Tax=Phaeocystidibacter marisrubri TaxID=1577780 RepID=A0A6L3ZEZ7_9FLAO|nr:M1 family metallopeptidase [Phaeocystidibacter marisrubri]KAB2816373.1 M1 family metallopeptidase [Phaeocystidibacter marisrubri]GGH68721.1 aminopeptidase [Phaeocystidibacter marisrubri]